MADTVPWMARALCPQPGPMGQEKGVWQLLMDRIVSLGRV